MKEFSRVHVFISLLVLSTMTVILSQKIHLKMNRRERAEVFQSPSDNVPHYEIVSIHWPTVQNRNVKNGSSVQLKAFGNHIKLWLNPSEGMLFGHNTPIYVMRNTSDGPKIVQVARSMGYTMLSLYEDLRKAASLAVNFHPGPSRAITGVIGSENLAIRPLPPRFAKEVTRYRRSLDGIHDPEYDDYHYHIVYKITPAHNLTKSLDNLLTPRRIKRSIPSVVYPEILVIVDYNLYKYFHQSIHKILPYLLSFWNGVDMKFRSLENPRYRLNIASILLVEDDSVLEYIKNHRYDNETIFGESAMNDKGRWLFKQDKFIPINSYDIAVTMAMNRMCYKTDAGECTGDILGMVYPSKMCDVDVAGKNMLKTSMIRDEAAYRGILPAAHALGHALGALHDGIYDQNCSYTDRNIMSSIMILKKDLSQWSSCALRGFQSYLESNDSMHTCIYNQPPDDMMILRYLPGRILDADKQCKVYCGTKAVNINERICQELLCISNNNSDKPISTNSPAADGTGCGYGKLCLNGQCLLEREIYF